MNPPTVYVPFASKDRQGQRAARGSATLIVKVSGANELDMAPVLRREIQSAQKEVLVTNIQTQTELVEAQTIRERLLAMLSFFSAAVSLALACVGRYGVLNYSVVQRRREIGIRLALGAKAGDVARLVTTEVFVMVGRRVRAVLGEAIVRRARDGLADAGRAWYHDSDSGDGGRNSAGDSGRPNQPGVDIVECVNFRIGGKRTCRG